MHDITTALAQYKESISLIIYGFAWAIANIAMHIIEWKKLWIAETIANLIVAWFFAMLIAPFTNWLEEPIQHAVMGMSWYLWVIILKIIRKTAPIFVKTALLSIIEGTKQVFIDFITNWAKRLWGKK